MTKKITGKQRILQSAARILRSKGLNATKLSDIAEGAVPLDEVKDTISADLLSTKQDDLYDTTVDGWVTDANAKVYKDRLAD